MTVQCTENLLSREARTRVVNTAVSPAFIWPSLWYHFSPSIHLAITVVLFQSCYALGHHCGIISVPLSTWPSLWYHFSSAIHLAITVVSFQSHYPLGHRFGIISVQLSTWPSLWYHFSPAIHLAITVVSLSFVQKYIQLNAIISIFFLIY